MPHNPEDFRPNVGMMIINQKKEIFVGKRIDHPSDFWQMPQGGIDAKEIPAIASLREIEEEVGIQKSKLNSSLKVLIGITIHFPKILLRLYGRGSIKVKDKNGSCILSQVVKRY
jgi:putative (di)nucleoside polyphosphate hydrolase